MWSIQDILYIKEIDITGARDQFRDQTNFCELYYCTIIRHVDFFFHFENEVYLNQQFSVCLCSFYSS